jgi:hypothetical protein
LNYITYVRHLQPQCALQSLKLDLSACESLRNKARAAFGAACIQNSAARFGRHTGAEAVRARTFEITGLESPFHGLIVEDLEVEQRRVQATCLSRQLC